MAAQVVLNGYEEEAPVGWEGVDERQEQWDRLRRRVAPRPHPRTPCIAALCQAYEEATHSWTGCD
jgi:hypothetical protein